VPAIIPAIQPVTCKPQRNARLRHRHVPTAEAGPKFHGDKPRVRVILQG